MYNNKHHQFDIQYNHKLFAHCNRWGADVLDYLHNLRPRIVKFLDPNLDNVRAIRDLLPDSLLIYRQWQPSQPLGNSTDESFQLGYDLGKKLTGEEIIKQGLVNLVEGYNEVLGETAPEAEHRKYASFQLGFKAALENLPVPVEPIAFNFGTGNMDAALIMTCYDEVLATYKWLGFHEYDWPTMDRLHNIGLADGNGGMWLALRYRRIMEPIIEAQGNNWSVVITECGMTQGVLGGQDVGFAYPQNTTSGEWANHPAPITAADYWDSLRWYSDELMNDDYVAGACMFVTGALSPWESFETIGTITPLIKDYQKEIEDNGGSMADIYVNDVRSNDDQSLNLIPRITNFAELKQHFGLDVDTTYGGDRATPGQRYWKLVGFEVRTGVAAFLTQVKQANGDPASDILVFNNWPDAPDLPVTVDPEYFHNAKAGYTDGSGVQGAPYSGGAVTGPNGGPYNIWLSADPSGGSRIGSDMAAQLGWIGGTDHLTANPIFRDVIKEGAPPPAGGEAKLVVYDSDGKEIGYAPLLTGQESGGRIALVIGGIEQGYTPLKVS